MTSVYRGENTESGLRLDMLVEDNVSLELKSVKSLFPIHKAQLLACLKLSNKPCGFLINFNMEPLKNDLVRLVY